METEFWPGHVAIAEFDGNKYELTDGRRACAYSKRQWRGALTLAQAICRESYLAGRAAYLRPGPIAQTHCNRCAQQPFELSKARSSEYEICKNRARGFKAKPRAIKLIATSSVLEEHGGILMTTFFSSPSITF